jgi:hypothetical protein
MLLWGEARKPNPGDICLTACGRIEVSAHGKKEETDNAFTSNIDGSYRGRRFAVAGQQLHTDGWIDQIHLECGCGDRCGFVAPEHFWSHSFSFPDPRRSITNRYSGWYVGVPDRVRLGTNMSL